MKTPDIPQDEKARLTTLRSLNILDTPQEERFDRLTRMSKRMFGVPIALVSLVDENRQWFKSCEGLSVRETPRDISFCGHAILGNEIFLISDATKDERFADNPLVLNEPHIRFYAGCPLRFPNGSKLGTLCLIDRKPRSLSEEDLEALRDLASMVERELEAVQLATLDELTNISNRRGFMMLSQHGLNFCARQGIPASLVFLDLNAFKPINDRFGHAEGDWALKAFAAQMKSVFRDSDIFARLGGDEFVVLLTNTSKKLAEDIIERFRQSLGKYIQKANRGYDIAFSYGIVEFNPEKHRTVEAFLAEGDLLMYECKNQRSLVERQRA
ncbi:MAG: sensor domain-containing diguanylate cyclase [Nitrospirota bacterium]|nr:sensor domain-containing diguanylate cyclase [Nitrospirota bacterium]MDH5296639.1 sensor domain-containing diguanylate cyclase [Nitrospirota bacterium]MDH5575272.1 sensor domain-containing diguanylate cyclase [Nitrospirota bacterium]